MGGSLHAVRLLGQTARKRADATCCHAVLHQSCWQDSSESEEMMKFLQGLQTSESGSSSSDEELQAGMEV